MTVAVGLAASSLHIGSPANTQRPLTRERQQFSSHAAISPKQAKLAHDKQSSCACVGLFIAGCTGVQLHQRWARAKWVPLSRRCSTSRGGSAVSCRASSTAQSFTCGYAEVQIGGRPASVWLPVDAEDSDQEQQKTYSFIFSWRKLPQYLLGISIGGDDETVELPTAPGVLALAAQDLDSSPQRGGCRGGVVIAHGLLCSRLDFAHLAERLCQEGFLVISPEFDDSVSHEEGVVSGGFIGALSERKPSEQRRVDVVEEAMAWLKDRGAGDNIAMIGHSRGGVTVSQLDGRFCRVNIAGFLPPPTPASDGFHPSASSAPMLVVCGQEDEVCARPPLSLDYVQQVVEEFIPQAEEWYPEDIGHLTVLDPRVRERWALNLGLFGGLARPPLSDTFDQEFVERITTFVKTSLPIAKEVAAKSR